MSPLRGSEGFYRSVSIIISAVWAFIKKSNPEGDIFAEYQNNVSLTPQGVVFL